MSQRHVTASRCFVLSVLIVLQCIFGCGMDIDQDITNRTQDALVSTPISADVLWWKQLSQTDRNRTILNQATVDDGKNVGLQCKTWVQQRVVPNASRSVAIIPATCPDANGWIWCLGGNAVGISTSPQNFKSGYIVQMNIKRADGSITPHTSIVYAIDAYGIWWIDSNYVAVNTVGMHYQTFLAFLSSVYIGGQYKYSTYYVGS